MKKIIVIGSTGSGKSTLAKQMAKTLAYPYIQLDLLFWKPNWQHCDDEEFFEKISNETNSETWIIDGNYTRSHQITWTKADTVIWIDLPFYLTLYQNISRSLKRAITRQELWPNTNNRESFLRMFSKDSIVLWLLNTYDLNKKKYQERLSDTNYQHIKFYRLQSRKEVRQFLKQLKLQDL